MNKEQVMQLHKDTINAVHKEHYYVNLFDMIMKGEPEVETINDVCTFWNHFYFALPDSKAIRRDPFYQICSLAEGSYLEEDDV